MKDETQNGDYFDQWIHHGFFSRLFNVAIHRSNEFAHVVTKSQEQ